MFFESACIFFIQFCSGASLLINAILLPLILYRSSNEIGTYRYLLLAYCLVTISFAGISFLSVPIFSQTKEGWIMYATLNFLPQSTGSWLSVLFCGCYVVQISIITLSFFYRYLVVCRPCDLHWFHERKYFYILLIPCAICCALWTCVTGAYLRPTQEMNDVFEDRVYALSGLDIHNVSYIGGVAYKGDQIVWEFVLIFSCRIFIVACSTIVIVFCVCRILRKFQSYAAMSSRTLSIEVMQKKLFLLLLTQTCVPLFLVYLPAVCGYTFAFLRISHPQLTTLFSTALPLAQLIDPLLIILIISEYRHALMEFFNMKASGRQGVSQRAYRFYAKGRHPARSLSSLLQERHPSFRKVSALITETHLLTDSRINE